MNVIAFFLAACGLIDSATYKITYVGAKGGCRGKLTLQFFPKLSK